MQIFDLAYKVLRAEYDSLCSYPTDRSTKKVQNLQRDGVEKWSNCKATELYQKSSYKENSNQ